GRVRARRCPTQKAAAAVQPPATATGSHTKVACKVSKSSHISNRSLLIRPGNSPNQLGPASASATIQALRNRNSASGAKAYTAAPSNSTKAQALDSDAESERPNATRIWPAKPRAVAHWRQKGPASVRSTATAPAQSTSPTTRAPCSVCTRPETARKTSSSRVLSQALRPSRPCTYQAGS